MDSIGHLFGYSVAVTFGGCNVDFLERSEQIYNALHAACETAGYKIVAEVSHTFSPQGATYALILAQSHLVCHTWPEHQVMSVDLFACAPEETLALALAVIRERSGSQWESLHRQVQELDFEPRSEVIQRRD
jgi:S-adenosylmethionine decarboxylase proenzyme